MKVAVTSDPVLALILAAHTRSMGAMEELQVLAKDQEMSNEQLKKLRALEGKLRDIRSDHEITRGEIDELKRLAKEAKDAGIAIDLDALFASLENYTFSTKANVGEYIEENSSATEGQAKKVNETLESIKDAIGEAKENVKGEASNRELDIQRITQEVSSAMQLQSNLSKTWNDVSKGIIANIRA
ncbi:MAG: hypothetical protein H6729_08010 [Deltaproteobacteria bacterium]|nr:hypothetical protein [Deltaproteobacteria bacterium]